MRRVIEPFGPAGALFRSWFRLTREEQRVLAAVLFLFILGIGVRAWRGTHTGQQRAPEIVTSERDAK